MIKSNRNDVIDGYRLYFGRAPESETAINAKVGLDKAKLLDIFISSPELKQKATASNVDIFVFGNCQAAAIKKCINTMSSMRCESIELTENAQAAIFEGRTYVAHFLANARIICFQLGDEDFSRKIIELFKIAKEKIRILPKVVVSMFHPDMIYITKKDGSTIGSYNSRIALFSFMIGLSKNEAKAAFNYAIFDRLNYFNCIRLDRRYLATQTKYSAISLNKIFEKWVQRKEVFMHTINHPKIGFLADIASDLLQNEQIPHLRSAANYMPDPLSENWSWSPYPEIALTYGLDRPEYFFKLNTRLTNTLGTRSFDLNTFIDWQYEEFSNTAIEDILLSGFERENLKNFQHTLGSTQPPTTSLTTKAANPYKGLADYQFWRRSVSNLPRDQVDPVTRPRFYIKREDRVATAGSCFAQHISQTLSKNGFNYFIAEASSAADAAERNFGVYSARYGNVYSTKQLLQLFDRAYGRFIPTEDMWKGEDGTFVDPYRPQIEPGGFKTEMELLKSREDHMAAVRRMFEEMDVFVFTLGLTEIWRNRIDGAVFPLAPGVVAGTMDEARYEFANLGALEVKTDLQLFIDQLSSVNPTAKIILTVSPVPLMATYEDRHVLSSTTLSKSVLRVVADEICRSNPHVDYFPSYEIITGNYSRGDFYEDDLRSVRPNGVSQVMFLFMKHYGRQHVDDAFEFTRTQDLDKSYIAETVKLASIVCDEEALDN